MKRICRNLYDPSYASIFFNDEIIIKIVIWITSEISLKRRESMTGATFCDTNEDEICALNNKRK